MLLTKFIEGEVNFDVPAAEKPCKTWYKVFGNLKSGTRPLVCLHGGPGVGHDYMLAMQDMTTKFGIPVVLYDQLGTGLSTHLPEKRLDTGFWTVQLFLDELDNLLKHLEITDYDVIGHSWGGMLGASHAIDQPKGLNRLIISDSPASMELWVEACDRLRNDLPKDVQETLKKHEADGTTDSEEYEEAVGVFYAKHLCRVQPMPEDLQKGLEWIKKDDTVYYTMYVVYHFSITATNQADSLPKEWSFRVLRDRLSQDMDRRGQSTQDHMSNLAPKWVLR